ncbi:MAG TPA: 23S rRNA (adenine(2503)-C(2))-methyltransferase RlmN [Negativicutes bacterium]|nr:23S rRNA (adenine(2503)-C(2))-methyltransferase RlmN [Negativicutes bacterium]
MIDNLYGLFVDEIAWEFEKIGIEKYRAAQVAEWMYQRGIDDFSKMTNLSTTQRSILREQFCIEFPEEQEARHSADGKTTKYLLRYSDGAAVETVLMRQPYGNSVCVSSQVGCAMGCKFCASTLSGLERNLTGGEMLAQVQHAGRALPEGQRVSSVVIMGGGEPLANLDEVLRFMRLCHESYILDMGYRSFTVSTCGLVPGIHRLQEQGLPVTLSISLHAPNDEIRSRLMPISRKYSVPELMTTANEYALMTKRRVTIEYAMINGVNDSPEHAKELATMLRGKLMAVNLIPLNPVPESGLQRSTPERISRFEEMLRVRRITVTVRREMGADIDAACGQLRQKSEKGGVR